MLIKIDGKEYRIEPSVRMWKKYDVYNANGEYIVSFGDKRYEQFYDKIGYYKFKDHNDEERRRRYYKRHGIEAEKLTAKWFSHNFLW